MTEDIKKASLLEKVLLGFLNIVLVLAFLSAIAIFIFGTVIVCTGNYDKYFPITTTKETTILHSVSFDENEPFSYEIITKGKGILETKYYKMYKVHEDGGLEMCEIPYKDTKLYPTLEEGENAYFEEITTEREGDSSSKKTERKLYIPKNSVER